MKHLDEKVDHFINKIYNLKFLVQNQIIDFNFDQV